MSAIPLLRQAILTALYLDTALYRDTAFLRGKGALLHAVGLRIIEWVKRSTQGSEEIRCSPWKKQRMV